MRLTGSRAYTRAAPVPKMPLGLVELMEGLTKDVLRNNPSNVYEFCSNHLEMLLEMRDGPSPKKTLTLEEKIFNAQEKVRQRAIERQKLFESEVLSAANKEPENVENSTQQDLVSNLRALAPVHHDQELSLSSEVEISHELTDNSLTSKDSIFDEADESSVSKSTVIDVLSGNDHETNIEENVGDGIENILELERNDDEKVEENIVELKINKDEQVKENEVMDGKQNEIVSDEVVKLPKIEINHDEPALEGTGSQIVDDHKYELAIEKNIVPSSVSIDKIQEKIDTAVTNNGGQQVVKEESDAAVTITTCKENLKQELADLEEQSSIVIKDIENDPKTNLKSLDVVNLIVEEGENYSSDVFVSILETDFSVEVYKNDIKESAIKNKEDNLTDNILNELVPTENLENETDNYTVIAPANTDNIAEPLKETASPEPVNDTANDVIDVKSSIDSHAKNSDPKEISVQIEQPNDSVHVSAEVFDEVIIPTPDLMEKNMIGKESKGINTSADEKSEVFENKSTEDSTKSMLNMEDNHSNDLEENNIIFTGVEENAIKENNMNSDFIYLQEPDITENNDDSSVIGSDLSKTEDDIPRGDNENDQTNMDLETAAVTIQKVFRSFLFKSRNSTFEDITNDKITSLEEDNDKNKEEYYATANLNKERRPLGITRMDTVLQTVNEEKSLSLSTDDSSTISSAATTIQAHVRGFLVRNRLNSYKTVSSNSLVNSIEILDTDNELLKHKTVLNIHIVPEDGLSRDESLITSMDLSLDGSPPSSINLHPLSYDLVSERRKLLKREDAIQSVSPPSNNSGKLSEDSVKEVLINEDISKAQSDINEKDDQSNPENNSPETLVTAVPDVTVLDTSNKQEDIEIDSERRKRTMSSDESDVITPFIASPCSSVDDFEKTSKLVHSGEFHDVVLPTKVSRSDTTVVREFKNVLAYILLWNNL